MEQKKLNTEVEQNLRKVIKSFREIHGNGIFSEELFITFFKHLREEYSVYDELANVANLKSTDTPTSYVERNSVNYFKKTKFGFIDITYLNK